MPLYRVLMKLENAKNNHKIKTYINRFRNIKQETQETKINISGN